MRAKYDSIDFSIYSHRIDRRGFLDQLAEKARMTLDTGQDLLTRPQIELLCPLMRATWWMG